MSVVLFNKRQDVAIILLIILNLHGYFVGGVQILQGASRANFK